MSHHVHVRRRVQRQCQVVAVAVHRAEAGTIVHKGANVRAMVWVGVGVNAEIQMEHMIEIQASLPVKATRRASGGLRDVIVVKRVGGVPVPVPAGGVPVGVVIPTTGVNGRTVLVPLQ